MEEGSERVEWGVDKETEEMVIGSGQKDVG